MHFTLVYPAAFPDRPLASDPANEGFDAVRILELLDGLKERGHRVEVVDSKTLSDAERQSLYIEADKAVQRRGARYRIRTVFGSLRAGGGPFFGDQIPALLVYEDGDVIDVYPRDESGATVTVRQFMEALMAGTAGREG